MQAAAAITTRYNNNSNSNRLLRAVEELRTIRTHIFAFYLKPTSKGLKGVGGGERDEATLEWCAVRGAWC